MLDQQRANDGFRRATAEERIGMANVRTLQRKHRWAVRDGDFQAVAEISGILGKMGVDPTSGGGITDALQQQRIAADRAKNRADKQMQIRGVGVDANGKPNVPVNPGNREGAAAVEQGAASATPPAGTAPAVASPPSAGPSATPPAGTAPAASLAAKNGQPLSLAQEDNASRARSQASGAFGKPFVNEFSDSKSKFAADLDRSDLIQNGNPTALKNADARGKILGLRPGEIRAYLNGTPGEFDLTDGAPKAIPVQSEEGRRIAEKYAGGLKPGDAEKAKNLPTTMSPEAKVRSENEQRVIDRANEAMAAYDKSEGERVAKRDAGFKAAEETEKVALDRSAKAYKVQKKQTEDYFSDLEKNEAYNRSVTSSRLKSAFMDRRVNPEQPAPIDPTNTLFDDTKPNYGLEGPVYKSQYVNAGGKEVFTGKSQSLPGSILNPLNWIPRAGMENALQRQEKQVLDESRLQRESARRMLEQDALESSIRRSATVRTILPEE